MSKLEKFYKIVDPLPTTKTMQDSQDVSGGTLYNSHSWYQRLVQGSSTRQTRYREYDNMDDDVDVARALDTIAEEMTQKNRKTGLPIDIDFQDLPAKVEDTQAVTLQAALRYWSNIQDYDTSLFHIARNTVKFGDCFFRKINGSNTRKWEYVHPKNVIAAVVAEDDVTHIIAWQVRQETKKAQANIGGIGVAGQQYQSEFVPAEEFVRFSLNNDMSETAPFGESVLKPVYRVFKQKQLLEDAVLIYRISRAPERRVFYIDVGKMPPHRTKQYLEQIKNEIKQKKIPSKQGGQAQVESVYNPHCISLDTKIPLLDGRELPLQDIIELHDAGEELWAYSCDPETGKLAPGLISWAGITRSNAKTIKIELDNGNTFTCTPDHKIPVQGRGFVPAGELTESDSLIPFNTRQQPIKRANPRYTYTQVYCNETKEWKYVHREVAEFIDEVGSNLIEKTTHMERYIDEPHDTIHHIDFNRYNNTPNNLTWMNSKDHVLYHSTQDMSRVHEGYRSWLKCLNEDPERYRMHFKKCASIKMEKMKKDPARLAEFTQRFIDNTEQYRTTFDNQEQRYDAVMFTEIVSLLVQEYDIKVTELLHKLNNSKPFMSRYQELNPTETQNDDGRVVSVCKIDNTKFTKRSLDKLLQTMGYGNWRQFRVSVMQNAIHQISDEELRDLTCTIDCEFTLVKQLTHLLKTQSVHNFNIVSFLASNQQAFSEWKTLYESCFNTEITVPEHKQLERVAKLAGYTSFKQMTTELAYFNHKIVKIEHDSIQDVGTLTIDQQEIYHNYHTFAISAGIYIKNSTQEDFFFAQRSDGKGSRVETLPGGQGLGELSDLEFFQARVYRGLRVPTSYMQVSGGDNNPIFNDGRIGQAYIEELRFAEFCMRLQRHLERELDEQFKSFLRDARIGIDPTCFKLRLPEPTNFGVWKQQEADAAILGTLSQADGITFLAKRFILSRYGQLSEEEILTNESMLREERGIGKDTPNLLMHIYGNPEEANAEGALGGLGGGDLGGGGGDLGDDMFAGDEDLEGGLDAGEPTGDEEIPL